MQKTTMQEHFTLTWSFFSLSRLKKVGFNLLVLQIPKSNPLIGVLILLHIILNGNKKMVIARLPIAAMQSMVA